MATSISPYLLEITIHGATNLPIFDILTSDPFVTISVDDNEIGRTKTMYKQLSPVYEEKFNTKLYHKDLKICFRIYDEDSTKNDLMGVVIFDLSTCSPDGEGMRQRYPLMSPDLVTATKGKLDFTVKLTKNSDVISLRPVAVPLLSDATMTEFESLIPQITSASVATSDAILRTIKKSPHLFLDHPKDIEDVIGSSNDLLSDLIQDCTALFSNTVSTIDNRIAHHNTKVNGTYINVSKHSVSSDAYTRIPPMNIGHGLILVTESSSIVLKMSNIYLTWIWLRWLKAALQHWDKGFKHDDWILEHELSAELFVTVKQSKKCVENVQGRCQLSLDTPYKIQFDEFPIDFSQIKGIILSSDAREYEPAYINIEITTSMDYNIGDEMYNSYLFLKMPSGTLSSEPTANNSITQKFSIDLPKGQNHDGIYIAYYQGLQNMESEKGQGYIPFSSLVSNSQPVGQSMTIDLNNSFNFKITVVKASGLKVSESGSQKKIYIKCKAVEWNGDRTSKSFMEDGTFRSSKSLEALPTVTWNETFNICIGNTFNLISGSEYFRLEVFVNEIGVMTDVKIGAIFIPFWKFKNKADMMTLPIMNFRNSTSLCSITSSTYDDHGLGDLTVIIQRISETNVVSPVKVNVKCTAVNERSLYSNKWSGECLMSGSMNSAVVKAESVLVDLNHSGLIITIIDEYEYNNPTSTTAADNNNAITNTNNGTNAKPKKKRIASLCGCFFKSYAAQGSNEPITVRGRALVANPDAIVILCKQRNLESDSFTIEWDKIHTFNLVSENILSVTFNVDKYFGEDKGIDVFREVLIEMFVYNCPSNSLKSLIQERKSFSNLRSVMASAIFNSNPGDDDNLDPTAMSMGSSIAAFLDAQANEIESLDIIRSTPESLKNIENDNVSLKTEEAVQKVPKHSLESKKNIELDKLRERAVLLRRACRFRLYEAVLLTLGSEIPGNYINIGDKESISNNDMQSAKSIALNDAIETANGKIDFLMKVAENRLRDIALCGWDQWMEDIKTGEKKLESCICFFINEYLIEMVGILATLLESKTLRSSKGGGLQSKIILINTFVDNNDKLKNICESVLRPYDLSCVPSPCLSAFLDIDTLIAFYADTLHDEMKQWVEGVVKVWKDKSKDAGGNSSSYRFDLPWNPMRVKGEEGEIISTIPEESKSALEDYARIARLDKDKVHDTFQKSFYKLDEKVAVAYTSAFLFLSHKYMDALISKDWGVDFDSKLSEEDRFDQQDEEIEWLCSVINDCFRINANSLMIPDEPTKKKKKKKNAEENNPLNKDLSYVIADTVLAFESICIISVDSVACSLLSRQDLNIHTLFKKEFSNIRIAELFEHLNSSSQANSIIDDSRRTVGLYGHKDCIVEFSKTFTSLLQGLSDFLSAEAYVRLAACCVDKVVILYLFLLREVYESRLTYTTDCAEFQQVKLDIDKLKHRFTKVTPSMYVESVMRHFRILDQIVVLIGADISDLKPTILELQHEAEGNPYIAEAIGSLINVCLELRSDFHSVAEEKRKKDKEIKELEVTHTRRHTFMGMFSSSENRSRSPSPTPEKANRARSPSPTPDATNPRSASPTTTGKSMMSYFRRKSKDVDVEPTNMAQAIHALESEDQDNDENKTNDSIHMTDVTAIHTSPDAPSVTESPLVNLMDSLNDLIDDITSEYDSDVLNEDIQLSTLKPVYSVFSKDVRITTLTLSEILFKSSTKAVRQKLKMVSLSKNKVSSRGGLFSWGLDGKTANNANNSNGVKTEMPKVNRSKSAVQMLGISEVKANNLFGLESMRQPKFSVEFTINGQSLSGDSNVTSTRTNVISGNLNPSWIEETYKLQYDFGVENVLTCKLIYSWMVSGEECIGVVNIPLRKLDFKSMLDTYPIEFLSKKAKIKAEKYEKEKRELPSISLHLSLI